MKRWIIILTLFLMPATWPAWGCECEDVDVNQVAATELDCLPGIGPVLAKRIVTYREANGPFATVEDLQNVAGIGPVKLAGMKDLIIIKSRNRRPVEVSD